MAEIHQKIVTCPVCHNFYDAAKDASCPFCSGKGSFMPTLDPFAGAVPGFTSDSDTRGLQNGQTYGSFQQTTPPDNGGGLSSRMESTQFVDASTPTGAPSPVVGWLVAVSGPCRGTDYRVHTGYNYIGRESGDICIRGDQTISGERDSNITYVPQTNRFYIAHEQGKNVLLVNDLPVIGGGTELHNYDRITIGTTLLVFVGLCGENFSWSGSDK